jgi:hypothetical protein
MALHFCRASPLRTRTKESRDAIRSSQTKLELPTFAIAGANRRLGDREGHKGVEPATHRPIGFKIPCHAVSHALFNGIVDI